MIALFFSLLTLAHAHTSSCDFPVPAYTISAFSVSAIPRASYDHVNATLMRTYAKKMAALGCPLVVHDEWLSGIVNAEAWQEGGKCHVAIYGGLARHPLMTERALLQVGFHEIGHHLGGEPTYDGVMSCEGQADYFSTRYAMPRAGLGSANSSLALARVLADLGGEAMPWRPGPALARVSATYCYHPAAQCRLQQYDRGRLRLGRAACWYRR